MSGFRYRKLSSLLPGLLLFGTLLLPGLFESRSTGRANVLSHAIITKIDPLTGAIIERIADFQGREINFTPEDSIFQVEFKITEGMLRNLSSESLLLVVEWESLKTLELRDEKGNLLMELNRNTPVSGRPFLSHYPAFSFTKKNLRNKVFILRFSSDNFLTFPITLQEKEVFLKKELVHDFFFSASLWGSVIFILINLLLFYIYSKRFFLYLAISSITLQLFIFAGMGARYTILFPWLHEHVLRIAYIAIGFFVVFHTLFASSFLYGSVLSRWMRWTFNSMLSLIAIYILLALFGTPLAYLIRGISILSIAFLPFYLMAGILSAKRQDHFARYYVIGILFFYAGSLFNIVFAMNIIRAENWFKYGLVTGELTSYLYFFLGNIYRLKSILSTDRELQSRNTEAMETLRDLAAFKNEKYTRNYLNNLDVNDLLVRLDSFLRKERVYLNEELKSGDLANLLGITQHQLSQLLTEHLKTNFVNLVNQYRIEEAKKLLQENPDHTILRVAYDSGFGSKTTFNTTFKELTGETPTTFRRRIFFETGK